MLRFFEKKRFLLDVKAKHFLLETKMQGVETEWRRPGDGFTRPGGHSANLEARRSILRGSWRLCAPYLVDCKMNKR